MNTKQLRQKILDLAIRGKLVPQDPADEPASVLLERVRAEKERLIKEGKIKASKSKKSVPTRHSGLVPESKASVDKSHYGSLPDGWKWAMLSSLATFSGGKTPSTENTSFWNGNINWVTSKDMKQKYIGSTQVKMSELGAEQMQIFPPNTLLMVVRSGILRHTLPLAILTEEATVNQDLKTISFFVDDLSEFIYIYLSALNDFILTEYHTDGTTVDSINFDKLRNMPIPIPPLSEQQRICHAVNATFAVIDEIEQAKTDLKTAVERSKQKILSLAISGKLVPQDPADEPASALLERIRAEREQLVKKGKVKARKSKKSVPTRHSGLVPESKASVDNSYYENLPFELPETWAWARVIDICEPQESKLPTGETFRYIDIDAIDNKRHRVAEPKTMMTSQAPSRAAKGVKAGDTLFSMVRPYLQNIALVTTELGDCIASTGFYVCRPVQEIVCPNYLYRFFSSGYAINGINAYMRGDNSPSIRKDEMDNFGVPLPPIAEQQRIVTAIDAAFEQLDTIAATLE